MKRKIFPPAIVLIALILASPLVFTMNLNKNSGHAVHSGYTMEVSAEPVQVQTALFVHSFSYVIPGEDPHERHVYEFSFERIRKTRRFCKLWCILARMIVIISHFSVILYVFKSLMS